jgi:amino acid adenylation domain-containing protein
MSHSALANKISTLIGFLGLSQSMRYAATTSTVFDPLLEQIFCPLCAGGTSVIVPDSVRDDAESLSAYISTHRLSVLDLTPGVAEQLIRNNRGSFYLDILMIGGDVFPISLVEELRTAGIARRVFNFYGPTEACVDASAYEIAEELLSGSVPIGSSLPNYKLYVLDGALQPAPTGVRGELYIAGAGLARGYLKQPVLTAERFVADLYGETGTRMYRTGDLVRWRADGSLEFLGRCDEQVKIRGFRIEPGEIESALREFPEAAQAAVITHENQRGEKSLVGYVVAALGHSIDARKMRQKLAQRLPDYMVPAAIIELENLPLTPNGKLDRKALPEPKLGSTSIWRAPRDPKEEILCSLFAEVLGLERIGIDDNFFELGGHSLLAVRLLSRVRATLDAELQVRTLFDAPSVAQLSPLLRESGSARPQLSSVFSQSRPERLPLSFAQQRLWFLDRLGRSSTEYNMPAALRLRGELDPEILETAINTVISRHEILRTRFIEMNGEPAQVIEPELKIVLPLEDLTGFDEEQKWKRVSASMHEEGGQAFDLARGPMLRMKLLKLSEHDHILLRTMHHIVSDGWSEEIFNRELTLLYEALRAGRENPLQPPALQYADFALWQRAWLEEEALAQGLSYWKRQLAGIPEQLDLPTDRPRPPLQTFRAELCQAKLEADQLTGLKRLCRDQQTTLYMSLLAVFGVLLGRYSRQEDIVVGSPIANRREVELEEMIGFFVNTLVMRVKVMGEESTQELMAKVRRMALEAYEHQDLPFERLVEELSPQRSLNTTPIFQVVFALQDAPHAPEGMTGLEVEAVLGDELLVRYDLELHAWEKDSELVLSWLYNRDLFDRWRMEQMASHYLRLLEAMVADTGQRIASIDLLAAQERRQILEDWNQTTGEIPQATLVELFEEQVEKSPEAFAVLSQEQKLSYRELNERANRLAHLLIGMGIGPEDLVALALPRSPEMVVALLGVLKAGAAYLPLDPDYPTERLALMLEDALPALLLCLSETPERLPEYPRRLLLDHPELVERLAYSANTDPGNRERVRQLRPRNPAYVIYTSGSTGKPKGVMVTHQNVVRLFGATRHWFLFNADDVWTLFHSYAFDFSVWEIWGPLLTGGRLEVVPYLVSRSPAEFLRFLVKKKVTVLNQTPSAFYQLMQADKEAPDLSRELALRYVIFGGEALEMRRLRDWYERHPENLPSLINMYGITETTVHVSYLALDKYAADNAKSAIGCGIPDLRVYVLDAALQPMPVGVGGELYIAGAGLARGYLKRPSLTGARFIADPYGKAGSLMYRSGDLARWRTDGKLEYLGRADQQIKIRGFRIELGEVEAALAGHPDVQQAVVAVREDNQGEKLLVGYVVPIPGRYLNPIRLRQELAHRLPDYMVPSALVELEALPLTTNGKLDRKSLPEPKMSATATGKAPRSPREEILCGLFAEILGLEAVGIDENFFELGGHSLLATRLASRVRETLGVELAIRTLFESPSVAQLGPRLREAATGRAPLVRQQRPERVPLSYAQQRLWFLDRLGETSTEYNIPLALRLKEELDREALEKTVNTIISRHESLRTHFAEIDGVPVQVIEEELKIELPLEDLSRLNEEEQQERVKAQLREEGGQPFDLGRGPLLRLKLLKLGERDYILLRTMHHIASDGWSEGVFNREFALLYEAMREGRENPLKPLAVQYAD